MRELRVMRIPFPPALLWLVSSMHSVWFESCPERLELLLCVRG